MNSSPNPPKLLLRFLHWFSGMTVKKDEGLLIEDVRKTPSEVNVSGKLAICYLVA